MIMYDVSKQTDVVIVGGGPAGSATALFLKQYGIQSAIIEKDRFPRFHIGESLTGECGKALRELGLEDKMLATCYPVKYGVKVYNSKGKSAFWVPVMARSAENQLQESSTWQVRRSTFDKMLLDEAVVRGTDLINGQAIKPLRNENGDVQGVRVRTADGQLQDIVAKVVVDASGTGTFLCKAEWTSPKERGNYTNQVAIFSHVKGAKRDAGKGRDNTLIFYRGQNEWGWFIPVDDETVSIGIVVPANYFAEQGVSRHDFYLRELLALNPALTRRVEDITLVEEVRAISNYSYHIRQFTGRGFLCVGDSHRFVDPIFSFGLHFAVAEGKLAAQAIRDYLHGETAEQANPFAAYQMRCEQGQEVIQTMIDTFWQHSLAFGYMVHLKYVDEMIDMFAGRVYHDLPTPGVRAMRKLLAVS